MDCLR
jgi:hypothetical protein